MASFLPSSEMKKVKIRLMRVFFFLLLLLLSSNLIQRDNFDFLVEKEVGLLVSKSNLESMWVTEHSSILERDHRAQTAE